MVYLTGCINTDTGTCITIDTGGVLTVIHNKNNYYNNYKNIYKIISFYL